MRAKKNFEIPEICRVVYALISLEVSLGWKEEILVIIIVWVALDSFFKIWIVLAIFRMLGKIQFRKYLLLRVLI